MAGAATKVFLCDDMTKTVDRQLNCDEFVVQGLATIVQSDLHEGLVTIVRGDLQVTDLKKHVMIERGELLKDYLYVLLDQTEGPVFEAITAVRTAIGEGLIASGTPKKEVDCDLLVTDMEVCLHWVYFKRDHARALMTLLPLAQSRFNIKRIESFFLTSPTRHEILPLDEVEFEMAEAMMLSFAPHDQLLPNITFGPDNLLLIVAVIINITNHTRDREILSKTDPHHIFTFLHEFKARPSLKSALASYTTYLEQPGLLDSVASQSAIAMDSHVASQRLVDQ